MNSHDCILTLSSTSPKLSLSFEVIDGILNLVPRKRIHRRDSGAAFSDRLTHFKNFSPSEKFSISAFLRSYSRICKKEEEKALKTWFSGSLVSAGVFRASNRSGRNRVRFEEDFKSNRKQLERARSVESSRFASPLKLRVEKKRSLDFEMLSNRQISSFFNRKTRIFKSFQTKKSLSRSEPTALSYGQNSVSKISLPP